MLATDRRHTGVARLRPDRALIAFPEIRNLGYFTTVVEELDAVSTVNDSRQGTLESALKKHSLGLVVAGILSLWFVLYTRSDPSTHLGAFFGNAIADWLGSFMIVVATKYFYESRSAESRRPHPRTRGPATRFLIDHSLTIVLVATGIAWAVLDARLDPQGKAGQVIGNIVSEWGQLFGLVIITKYPARNRLEGEPAVVSVRVATESPPGGHPPGSCRGQPAGARALS